MDRADLSAVFYGDGPVPVLWATHCPVHFDVWLATGLEPGPPRREPTEQDLRCARFPVAEFEAMIARGEIRDAATVAAWHLVKTR